jgi:hypothetical protein
LASSEGWLETNIALAGWSGSCQPTCSGLGLRLGLG